jgi:hypothetical protein
MPWRHVDVMTERWQFMRDARRRLVSFTELCALCRTAPCTLASDRPALARSRAGGLLQLPDLHAAPGQNGDEHAVTLGVVADAAGTRHARDHLEFLPGLVARYCGVGPARCQKLAPAICTPSHAPGPAPPRSASCRRASSEQRVAAQGSDDETLPYRIHDDPSRPGEAVAAQRHGHCQIRPDAEDAVGAPAA